MAADCTITPDDQALIDGAAKWQQFLISDLIRFLLIAELTQAGIEIGEGCEFSAGEQSVIDNAAKWEGFQISDLLRFILAAQNP